MFSSRVYLLPLVTIVTLSVCAKADSIPYQYSGLKQSVQFQPLGSAKTLSIRLLLDSAPAQKGGSVPPMVGLVPAYYHRKNSDSEMRAMNLLEWLLTMIGKLVLPSHGNRRVKR